MDVVEIARQRRLALVREVARLDEFIRMAEELARAGGQAREQVPVTAAPARPVVPSPVSGAPQREPEKSDAGEERPPAAGKPAASDERPAPNTVRQFSAGRGTSA